MHIQKPGHFKKMYPLAAASCCCRLKSLKASKDYRHGHFTRLLHLHVFKEISFLEFSSLALHFQNIIWILLLSEFWFWFFLMNRRSSQEKNRFSNVQIQKWRDNQHKKMMNMFTTLTSRSSVVHGDSGDRKQGSVTNKTKDKHRHAKRVTQVACYWGGALF